MAKYFVERDPTTGELRAIARPSDSKFGKANTFRIEAENSLQALDRAREKIYEMEESEKSGIGNAFISGLTNNEEYKIRWLAEKRFPDDVERGIDPSLRYFLDEDGDIAYRDPRSGVIKKEFEESIIPWADVDDTWGNIAPLAQFTSEVAGGTAGLTAGALAGGIPGAVAGGAKGTAIGGGASYAVRAGLSAMLGGPPLDVGTAAKDLTISSAFGAIPIGAPTKSFEQFAGGILTKLPTGADGRTMLRDILEEGGQTVDDKVNFMRDKYGITITRAEAEPLVTNAAQLQYFLAKQPNAQDLWNFYHDRAAQVDYHAQNFFDELFSGKYVKGDAANKLSGKPSLDAPLDVALAAKNYLKKQKEELAEQVKPLYKDAYGLDVKIDVSDILEEVDAVIKNPNVSSEKKAVYKKIKEGLVDASTGEARNTTELLHEGLKDQFRRQFAKLTKDIDRPLKTEISQIRDKVSNRMKSANPLYKQVTDIYDDAIGTSQTLERSIVGMLANAAEKGGAEAARLIQRLFSGTGVLPKDITKLKNILQETPEGAQAWQNVKGTWLMQNFDDALSTTANPLGVANKFLSKLGIRGEPQKIFPQRGTRRFFSEQPTLNTQGLRPSEAKFAESAQQGLVRGKKAKILEAMFEPDELDNFVDLVELMQATSYISTRSASPTQTFQAIERILENEGMTALTRGKQITAGLLNLPSRLLARGFDNWVENTILKQKEAYQDLLIDALIDPKKATDLRAYLDRVNPRAYQWTQIATKGGIEALNQFSEETSPEARTQRLREESLRQKKEQEQQFEDLQTSLMQPQSPMLDVDMFEPLPSLDMGDSQFAMSPTIVPSESDREIAMRQMQKRGLGSLV